MVPAGNLLASVYPYPQEAFREYTPTGSQVRSVTIPPPIGSSADEPRDLVADANGKVYVYNGTFNPYLAIYDPATGTWSQTTFSGWSTVNNVSYGGAEAFKTYVFTSDMNTGGGVPNGLVRFDSRE